METKVITVTETAAKVIKLVKNAVSKSPTGVSFFSVRYYTNKKNEISHYSINLGANYEKAKAKDIEFLQNFDVTSKTDWKSSLIDLMTAKTELINSFIKPNAARSNGQKDAYETIIGNALKIHKETGNLHIYGYLKSKKVLVKGEYDSVNSSALTIAKDELRKLLRTSKFRQFSLDIDHELKTNGKTLFINYRPEGMVL